MRAVAIGPLGRVPITAAPQRWRPQMTLRMVAAMSRPYQGAGPVGLRAVVDDAQARTARRFFSSGLLPNRCGGPGMPPCDTGTPQSALSGLGVWPFSSTPNASVDAPQPRSLPGFCSPVRTLLSELEWLLGKVTYTSDVVRQAKFVFDDLDKNYAYVPGTGGCDRDTAVLQKVIADLRADMARNGSGAPGGTSSLTPDNLAKQPDVDPLVKFGIIAGVAVAGIIGLAVITGNAASIIKVLR